MSGTTTVPNECPFVGPDRHIYSETETQTDRKRERLMLRKEKMFFISFRDIFIILHEKFSFVTVLSILFQIFFSSLIMFKEDYPKQRNFDHIIWLIR